MINQPKNRNGSKTSNEKVSIPENVSMPIPNPDDQEKENLQSTFDYILEKMRMQGKQSEIGQVCRYRGLNGNRCPAGWLISDDQYRDEFEQFPVKHSPKVQNILQENGHNIDLVIDLQTIHDSELVDKWESCWKNVAKEWELIYNEPK